MPDAEQPGLIVRQTSPLNLEFPFSSLTDWVVPNAQFFVRNHFRMPEIDPAAWRLTISGAVERPLEVSLDDIRAMPATRLAAVIECAGNGRVYYEPAREGLQWQNGAVGNAVWMGVPLAGLLAQARPRQDAVEVVLIGADQGVVDAGKKTASPGPIAFARSLPLGKALSAGTLLAYAMNDEPLAPEHGFPLRAVVGGWFGMAWVKWLREIRVIERPFLGYWQARDYFGWERGLGEPMLVPLTQMEVKAQIARPVEGATLRAGRPFRIFGSAWSGEAEIRQVEVCCGEGWRAAKLLTPGGSHAWRLWEYVWTPPQAGRYVLRCRAIDAAGNIQPESQQPDRESYGANWIVPVAIKAVAEPYEEFVI
jgi:DMSO/TMAO reductase YedYZ molybdopterin-dependent catalytic subunit